MEVVSLVIKYAALDMESTKDGSVLCALMHVSCEIRAAVMRLFDSPLPLYESAVTAQPKRSAHDCAPTEHQVELPTQLLTYIIKALQWACTPDVGSKRVQPPPPPTEFWKGLATNGERFTYANVDILCKPDTVVLPSGKRTKKSDQPNQKSRGCSQPQWPKPFTCQDLCRAVQDVADRIRPAKARGCHPYHLALQGSLSQLPSAGAVFVVKLQLTDSRVWNACTKMRYEKTFQLDSLLTLRDKKGYPTDSGECL